MYTKTLLVATLAAMSTVTSTAATDATTTATPEQRDASLEPRQLGSMDLKLGDVPNEYWPATWKPRGMDKYQWAWVKTIGGGDPPTHPKRDTDTAGPLEVTETSSYDGNEKREGEVRPTLPAQPEGSENEHDVTDELAWMKPFLLSKDAGAVAEALSQVPEVQEVQERKVAEDDWARGTIERPAKESMEERGEDVKGGITLYIHGSPTVLGQPKQTTFVTETSAPAGGVEERGEDVRGGKTLYVHGSPVVLGPVETGGATGTGAPAATATGQ